MKKSRVISIFICSILLCFAFLGVFQFAEDMKGETLLQSALSSPLKAMLLVNNFIKHSATDISREKQNQQERKNNRLSEILFFISSSILTNNSPLVLLLVLVGGVGLLYLKHFKCNYSFFRSSPNMWHYLKRWKLGFWTPGEVCLHNRAGEYDINRSSLIRRFTPRTLNNMVRSAGFFYR